MQGPGQGRHKNQLTLGARGGSPWPGGATRLTNIRGQAFPSARPQGLAALPGGASQEWSRWQDVLHRAGQGQRTEAVCVWARGHQTEEEARKKAASNVIY